jgi:hypothetical protein
VSKAAFFLQKTIAESWLLERFEQRAMRSAQNKGRCENSFPKIFIVGAPRTGSTILYQLLISNFAFSHFTNLDTLFYNKLLLGNKLHNVVNALGMSRKDKFDSSFGFVQGVLSPSEAGTIFRHWLDNDNVDSSYLPKAIDQICLNRSATTGFISKNTFNSFRLEKLNDLFPDALFIHIKRSVDENMSAILSARKKYFGNEDEWLGVKPPNEDVSKIGGPLAQVYYQVKSVREEIEAKTKVLNLNVLDVNFEDLVKDELGTMNSIRERFETHFDIEIDNDLNGSAELTTTVKPLRLYSRDDVFQYLNDRNNSDV